MSGETSLAPSLELRDVGVSYRRRGALRRHDVHAVVGANLTVAPGEVVGIIGESGSGKSTLARAITGLVEIEKGTILVDGHDIADGSVKERRRRSRGVQIVFQNPYASLSARWSIEQIVAEPLTIWEGSMSSEDKAARVREALELVGVDPARKDDRPSAFSGGQRQRIALARALAEKPDLLICDEILSALDVSSQARLVELLIDIKKRVRCSIVLISHNIAALRFVADRVVVMYGGRIVEVGLTDQIIDRPRHPYTEMLVAAAHAVDLGARGQARTPGKTAGEVPAPSKVLVGCVFQERCPHVQAECRSAEPSMTRLSTGSEVRCLRFAGEGSAVGAQEAREVTASV